MITLQNDDEIYPTFWECITSMPIEDETSLCCERLQFIDHLGRIRVDRGYENVHSTYFIFVHYVTLPFLVKSIVKFLLLHQSHDIHVL
jgi:hypothetical protein